MTPNIDELQARYVNNGYLVVDSLIDGELLRDLQAVTAGFLSADRIEQEHMDSAMYAWRPRGVGEYAIQAGPVPPVANGATGGSGGGNLFLMEHEAS